MSTSKGKYSPRNAPLKERFDFHWMPEPNSGCWLWLGNLHCPKHFKEPYGRLTLGNGPNKRSVMAHRLAWELYKGEIPKGKKVLHKCDVPSCVNPTHLFLGTQHENVQDMIKKNRKIVAKGEGSGISKLKEKDVLFIREAVKSTSQYKLAKMFGVRPYTIWSIVHRLHWKHI